MKEHRIKIVNGEAQVVYSDELAPFLAEGRTTVTRASHVEPHPTRGGWVADMTPSDGPVLGDGASMLLTGESVWPDGPHARAMWDALAPFPTRQAALDAELAWLRRERGL